MFNAFAVQAQRGIKEIKLLEEYKNQLIKDIQFYDKKIKIVFANDIEKYGTIEDKRFKAEHMPELPKFYAPASYFAYAINPDFSIDLFWKGVSIAKLAGHTTEIIAVYLDTEKNLLISTAKDNTLKIWDLRSTRLKETINWPRGNLQNMHIHPSGEKILVQTTDKKLYLWKPAVLRRKSILEVVIQNIEPIIVPLCLHKLRASL